MALVKPPLGACLDRRSPLAKGLVGCWLFNEGGGMRAFDISGLGNHGTLTNMANPSSSASGRYPTKFGTGLIFDGSDDRIDVTPLTVMPVATFSTSVWFNTTIAAGVGYLFAKMSGVQASNNWQFAAFVSSVAGAVVAKLYGSNNNNQRQWASDATGFNDGGWHHFVVTIGAGGTISNKLVTIYVDGSARTTTVTAFGNQSDTYANKLGAQSTIGAGLTSASTFAGFYPGNIENFRIYNRALSQAEVSELYRNPYAGVSMPTRRRIYGVPSVAVQNRGGFFGFM